MGQGWALTRRGTTLEDAGGLRPPTARNRGLRRVLLCCHVDPDPSRQLLGTRRPCGSRLPVRALCSPYRRSRTDIGRPWSPGPSCLSVPQSLSLQAPTAQRGGQRGRSTWTRPAWGSAWDVCGVCGVRAGSVWVCAGSARGTAGPGRGSLALQGSRPHSTVGTTSARPDEVQEGGRSGSWAGRGYRGSCCSRLSAVRPGQAG